LFGSVTVNIFAYYTGMLRYRDQCVGLGLSIVVSLGLDLRLMKCWSWSRVCWSRGL